MNTRGLMVFAVLLIFAGQASAGTVTILSVGVVPNQPLNTDLITFNIFGLAAQGNSWVDHDVFSQNGTALTLDLYVAWGAGGSGSNWYFDKQIQPLVPGTYSLEVKGFNGQVGNPFYGTLQDTYETVNFTVTPEPCTLALLGLGLPFIGRFSKRKI